MVTKAQLLSKLPAYVGSAKILKYDQGTGDIINELLKEHDLNAKDYDRIYKYFYTGDILQTAKNVFAFLKRNIKYNIESGAKQTLKSPTAILVQGSGDCKLYAQFIGGILGAIQRNENIKFNWCYRFASYNPQKAIQHVFVALIYKGKEYEVDPVLSKFNEYKSWTYKVDKKTKDMALYQISGVQNNQVGKTILGKGLKAIAKGAKAVAKVVVKVGTTPARNAFLLLVRLNVLQMATKMGSKLSKIEPELKKLWSGLGGNYNTLKSTIIKGSKNKIGASVNGLYNPNTIGAEPVSSTAVALAGPIIIAIKKILKDVGIDADQLLKAGKDILIDKVEQVIDDNLPPAIADQITNAIDLKTGRPEQPNKANENFALPNLENPNGAQIEVSTKTLINPNTGVATLQASEKSFDFQKYLLPAGAVLAVYLITKNK